MITEIVIHKSLIDEFKQDALGFYPHEHIQAILGRQFGSKLIVYAFYDLNNLERSKNEREVSIRFDAPEIEIEDTKYKYFGNIHSHPDGPLKYSKWDAQEFVSRQEELIIYDRGYQVELLSEKIMGIMQINKLKAGCQWGIVFYNEDLEIIPLVISETSDKKGA
jgi:proteasome lid subunit RPN8/RPN11